MTLYEFINKTENSRLIFGKGEIRILKKQLLGISLTQSEKNRLSRSIRPKLEFVKDCSVYKNDFDVKKGSEINHLIEQLKDVISEDILKKKIKRIFLFGSFIQNKMSYDSDVDIAIEFKEITKREGYFFKNRISQKISPIIDISILNFMQENIKNEVLSNGKLLFENK